MVILALAFKTEALAQKFIIEGAKQWAGDRLRSARAIPSRRKLISYIVGPGASVTQVAGDFVCRITNIQLSGLRAVIA